MSWFLLQKYSFFNSAWWTIPAKSYLLVHNQCFFITSILHQVVSNSVQSNSWAHHKLIKGSSMRQGFGLLQGQENQTLSYITVVLQFTQIMLYRNSVQPQASKKCTSKTRQLWPSPATYLQQLELKGRQRSLNVEAPWSYLQITDLPNSLLKPSKPVSITITWDREFHKYCILWKNYFQRIP